MITIDRVTIRAGDFHLENASLSVPTGSYAVLMGRTGSGKTSLLEAVAGLKTIVSGRIFLGDRDVTACTPAERHIGYVPQDGALFEHMNVREHLAFALKIRKAAPSHIAHRVEHLAGMLEIEPLLSRSIHGLSGGEKQRVQLARVLAQIWEPVADHARVLILDEPTSSFDLAHQQLTIANMRSFAAQGVGVLVVIHDLNMAARCADQLLVLSCGRIAACGSPQQVLTATTIKQVFNVDVSIGINPLTGTPLVIA